MKRREKVKWRWELEEPKKEIIVPTLKEKIELGLSDQECILICFTKYPNSQCFRERNAQPLCSLCPKSKKIKTEEELAKEIEILLAKTMKKLVRKRRYRRR
ncbi:hypothetical protein KJA16_00160 [Patescibacteria group bacterium]|nr:hypothetical protein [Patescibacteria group bacterium]